MLIRTHVAIMLLAFFSRCHVARANAAPSPQRSTKASIRTATGVQRRRTRGMMRMMRMKWFEDYHVWTGGLGMMMSRDRKNSDFTTSPTTSTTTMIGATASPTTERHKIMEERMRSKRSERQKNMEERMRSKRSERQQNMEERQRSKRSERQQNMEDRQRTKNEFVKNYVHGSEEEGDKKLNLLHDYFIRNKITSLNEDIEQDPNQVFSDDDGVESIDQANQIFALALLGVALMSILCCVASFSACRYRQVQRKRREFQQLVTEMKKTVQVSCDELWIPPSIEEEGQVIVEPREEPPGEEEESTVTSGDSSGSASTQTRPVLEPPEEGDYAASYYKNGTLRRLVIHLKFLEKKDDTDIRDSTISRNRGWVISGHGQDETKGDFQVTQGLLSRTGCAYWVQEYKGSKRSLAKRQWAISGQWRFHHNGSFVGNWVTDSGIDGPFVSFEWVDPVVHTDEIVHDKASPTSPSRADNCGPALDARNSSTRTAATYVADDDTSASSSSSKDKKSAEQLDDCSKEIRHDQQLEHSRVDEEEGLEAEALAPTRPQPHPQHSLELTADAVRAWDEISQREAVTAPFRDGVAAAASLELKSRSSSHGANTEQQSDDVVSVRSFSPPRNHEPELVSEALDDPIIDADENGDNGDVWSDGQLSFNV